MGYKWKKEAEAIEDMTRHRVDSDCDSSTDSFISASTMQCLMFANGSNAGSNML